LPDLSGVGEYFKAAQVAMLKELAPLMHTGQS